MAQTFPGTDIEIGKWYPATLSPPMLRHGEEPFDLILGIKSIGPRSGFYDEGEKIYYWHCERYDSFDDEPIPGWTREQEINNNLDWVYEKARGVSCWMLIPDFDNGLPSIDGTTGFDPDPDQVHGSAYDEYLRNRKDDDSELDEPDPGFPFHLN